MDVVRRNPKSFLSEKERVGISRVGLLTDIDIQKVACGLQWPDFCITKAITFEKGYHTSEIPVTDIVSSLAFYVHFPFGILANILAR